jgi:hypothetical protein
MTTMSKIKSKTFEIKKIFLVFVLLLGCNYISASENLSIVYVHIGDAVPKHVLESIRQVRLHNPSEDIYLCGSSRAMDKIQSHLTTFSVKKIPVESLPQSEQHQKFLKDTCFTKPFWIRTTERLLVVHDLMKEKNLKNVFHIESDVMIYTSFRDLLPIFIDNYPSIAIPFANDQAAICSLVYIKDEKAGSLIADCIANHAPEGENDMRLPGILKEEMGTNAIDHLPILPSFYVEKVDQSKFINKLKDTVQSKFEFSKNYEEFSCVFDAVTFGLLLSTKLTCEGTVFDPRVFNISWEFDSNNLYIPYIEYEGFKCKICNLHIHGKNLKEFRSDSKLTPPSWREKALIKSPRQH